jgi:hypothetical protein
VQAQGGNHWSHYFVTAWPVRIRIQVNNSDIKNVAAVQMPRTPSKRPFAAIASQKAQSRNPRTLQNRAYRCAKRGLEVAELRDDSAFRTSKSRALKKLRTSEGWVDMSAEEQAKAEAEAIHILEEKRDAKKREHKKQWLQKVENEDIASDEDDEQQDGDPVASDTASGDTAGREDEWFTEDDDDLGVDEGDDLDWISDFNDIKERYGDAFINALTEAEKKAVKKDEFIRL